MQYQFLTFFIWLFIFIASTKGLQLSEIPKSRSGRIRLFSNSNLNVSVEPKYSHLSASWRHIQVVNRTEADTLRINYAKYEPTWESLDARPLPKWFDENKIGIFIHWGVFSVPSFGSEWFWHFWKTGKKPYVDFMEKNYPPNFTYQDFGPQFTAEFFDPNRWAEVFSKSGAKYVVLTSKHHEGFTLWPSKYSFGWNALDIGPKRDIVGQLASAIRNTTDLKFGLYHSLFEWYNPLFLADQANNFTTNDFVNLKTMRELYEIVNEYKPEVLWSDGDEGPSYEYWQSREFLAWLYNDSPVKSTVVTNDRWGTGTACKHGGYFTCNDRYNPGVLQPHKWENCMTLDKNSWGYRRNGKLSEYLTPEELISTVVETVSCGGNILINVGPTKEGTISPLMEERLLQLGTWLEINGEAIYGSLAWTAQNDTITPAVWYTQKPALRKVYAFILKWPSSFEVQLGSVDASIVNNITLLGYSDVPLKWKKAQDQGVRVKLPSQIPTQLKWGWTLIIQS